MATVKKTAEENSEQLRGDIRELRAALEAQESFEQPKEGAGELRAAQASSEQPMRAQGSP